MDYSDSGYPRYFTRVDPREVMDTLANLGLDCLHHQIAEVPYMSSEFLIGFFEKRVFDVGP